ncbi:Protein kinase domain [Macleaya cordata]|uniref:non-specific serine/threonine protein kinase n=1 Tax=Macleaya cordata TaxID=56857 RepID=A0A200QBT3_MACCD|nr:Protein kinase domain [Macleaya cordata]
MGVGDLWVLFIFLVIFSQVQVLNSQNLTCNSSDLIALEGFLKGLESGIEVWGSTKNGSASSVSDCCNLFGVSCDSSSRVVGLELGKRSLRGNILEPLADLDQLKILNLSQNFLNGTLPSKLFQLQKLQILDLSFNQFTGSVPVEIDLPSIRFFDVSGNSFIGHINTGICNNSTRIRTLNLSMNYFTGNFPSGFGNCSSLQQLVLNSNYLSGILPDDLFSLQKLDRLLIQENFISGLLSDRISNLSNLVQLDVSLNRFSGILPDAFYNLAKLERFSAYSNKFFGPLPASLSNSPTIQLLNLRNNSLNGSIDVNCTMMVRLNSLDLGTNQFHGPLPDSLASCRELRTVNLARNFLNSQIPDSFKNMQSLTYLSLSNASLHNLSGALSILQQCKNLSTLVLTLNFQSEEMPTDANLGFVNLKALVIANCGLTGSIPQWLTSSTNLQLLDLSWNNLRGRIPDWFGEMESLFYLDLSNNSLSGEIPKSLTNLQSLINRTISFQEPSPDFPFFMKRNQSARGLQYNQIMSFPPSLDLSYNMLNGSIWPEFGNLKKLHVFDLKWNILQGPIPAELSGMSSLEMLDLSHNNLSGTIPSSLTNLSFLSRFSVAYNQLVGMIPSGGQFLTFPASSFEGNKGLFCSEHFNSCPPDSIPPVFPRKGQRSKGNIIGMAVGIGSGTVFLLIIIFLIVAKTHNRTRDDPEEGNFDSINKDLDVSGSRSVILFQNKEISNELSIDDLLKSTNNFDQANIIGCGGFGLVYKAILPDGRKVAIKRLSGDCGQMDREFQAEVEALSRAQHENLVLLQGYCSCKSDRLLIYSYMENGSLDYWLHEKIDGASSLDWETRVRIAQGAARGLAYLHQSCQPHILHRDVKSSNILLDKNFEAHLADFGLARLILPYDTHVSTDLVGTLGYIPPEYGLASVATFKGDVYSFGVVLLELLTGRRPMDMCKPKGFRDLISWVRQMKMEKRETEVFDPFIYDKEHDTEMLLVLEIACLCLSECPKLRPSTQQIVSWLDNINLNG